MPWVGLIGKMVFHSIAVEMVVNGVLRTLLVMSYRGVSMDVRFKTAL